MKIYSVIEYRRNVQTTSRLFKKEDDALEYAKYLHENADVLKEWVIAKDAGNGLFYWSWKPEMDYVGSMIEHAVYVREETVY